jgi:hypothetical protein
MQSEGIEAEAINLPSKPRILEKDRLLRWFVRVTFLSVSGSVVIVGSLPGILNAQQTGSVDKPNSRSTFLLGLLGGILYLSIAMFSKFLPLFGELWGRKPQLLLSLVGHISFAGLLLGGGFAGGSKTMAGTILYCVSFMAFGVFTPFTDFIMHVRCLYLFMIQTEQTWYLSQADDIGNLRASGT